jgi:hypothetical protein
VISQPAQITPGKDAGCVAVTESWLDRIQAHRIQTGDGHATLADLKHFLAWTMTNHLG